DANNEQTPEEDENARPDREREKPGADQVSRNEEEQKRKVDPCNCGREEGSLQRDTLCQDRRPCFNFLSGRCLIVERLCKMPVRERTAGNGRDRRHIPVYAGIGEVEQSTEPEE